jgi:hypothetical protein
MMSSVCALLINSDGDQEKILARSFFDPLGSSQEANLFSAVSLRLFQAMFQ